MSLLPSVPTKEYLDDQPYGIQNTFIRLISKLYRALWTFFFFFAIHSPVSGGDSIIFLSDGLYEPLPTGLEVYQVGSSILSAPPQ